MPNNKLKEKYYSLLAAYFSRQDEKYLFQAAELGREIIAGNIPVEEIAEIHEYATQKLGEEHSDTKLFDCARLVAAPLLEMLMSYGLASRELLQRRMDAEEAARESQRQLQTLFSNLPGMAYRCQNDENWTMEFVSAGAEQLTGYLVDDLIDNRTIAFADIIHPDDRDRVWQSVQSRLLEKMRYELEYRIIRKDGEERWVWERGQGVYDDADQVIALEGFISDITDRKRAEESLSESEDMYRTLIESSNDAIFIVKEGLIVFTNHVLSDLTGYDSARMLNTPFIDYVGEEDQGRVREFYQRRMAGKPVPSRYLSKVIRKDKTLLLVEVSVALFSYYGEPAELVFLRDISDRLKAEAEIRALNADLERRVLERTAQLQAVNRDLESFAYSISHDLRAPLRHIAGFSALLRREIQQGGAQQDYYFEKIDNAANRMQQMIDDLLGFSRIGREELSAKVVDINEIINSIIAENKPELDSRHIDWKIDDMPAVKGDARLLKMALSNLISNSLKFTIQEERAIIQIGGRAIGNTVEFFIKDNGVGFDSNYAHKLFKVFNRLHAEEDFPGTGIGLANVKRIIERHGGTVRCEGQVGVGAAFYFTLPQEK